MQTLQGVWHLKTNAETAKALSFPRSLPAGKQGIRGKLAFLFYLCVDFRFTSAVSVFDEEGRNMEVSYTRASRLSHFCILEIRKPEHMKLTIRANCSPDEAIARLKRVTDTNYKWYAPRWNFDYRKYYSGIFEKNSFRIYTTNYFGMRGALLLGKVIPAKGEQEKSLVLLTVTLGYMQIIPLVWLIICFAVVLLATFQNGFHSFDESGIIIILFFAAGIAGILLWYHFISQNAVERLKNILSAY